MIWHVSKADICGGRTGTMRNVQNQPLCFYIANNFLFASTSVSHLQDRSELSIIQMLLYELFTELWLDLLCLLYFAAPVYDIDGNKP